MPPLFPRHTRSCVLCWHVVTPCVTMLPASAITSSSDGPAFQSSFHILLFGFYRIYFCTNTMMQTQLLPRECRLTQIPQWQPSSTEVETKPASHTSHHHNLNHHPPQRQLPPTALLAASTSSIHVGHLPDASEYKISAPSFRNHQRRRTLRRSVTRDSNWRSRGSQQNGSLDP